MICNNVPAFIIALLFLPELALCFAMTNLIFGIFLFLSSFTSGEKKGSKIPHKEQRKNKERQNRKVENVFVRIPQTGLPCIVVNTYHPKTLHPQSSRHQHKFINQYVTQGRPMPDIQTRWKTPHFFKSAETSPLDPLLSQFYNIFATLLSAYILILPTAAVSTHINLNTGPLNPEPEAQS